MLCPLGRLKADPPDIRSRLTMIGAITSNAASDSRVSEIGRVTRTAGDPSAIASARRSCCSAIGPRMTPMIAGASGISRARMR